jgi:hypothetical protein
MAERLLFDTDSGDNTEQRRTFTVAVGTVGRVVAAGLSEGEEVNIYVAVTGANNSRTSAAINSTPSDTLWAKLYRAGRAISLTSVDNEHLECVPGNYRIGPASPIPVFAEPVNISLLVLDERYMGAAGDSGGGAAASEAPFLPATAHTVVGFVQDPVTKEYLGTVTVSRMTDRVTGETTDTIIATLIDGTVVTDYTGAWVPHIQCQPATPLGVLSSWG